MAGRHAIKLLFATLIVMGVCDGAAVAAEYQPFAVFNLRLDIDIEDGEVDLNATIAVGRNSRIDLTKSPLQLRVAGGPRVYEVTIPPGSFKADRTGRFAFVGVIDRVRIVAACQPARANTYELSLETEGANLNRFTNPATVTLMIGPLGGQQTVRAKIE